MAAIDKLYTSSYEDFDMLRNWINTYHPKLVDSLYMPLMTKEDWNQYRKCRRLLFLEKLDEIQPMAIANFTGKQDLLLLWRCPIPFVREYLENQCGLKTKWYHKIFWKGK